MANVEEGPNVDAIKAGGNDGIIGGEVRLP